MELTRQRLPIGIKPSDEQKLRDELDRNYRSIIESSKDSLRSHLASGKTATGKESSGEIYSCENGDFLYFYIPQERNYIETGCLAKDGEGKSVFTDFRDLVKEILLPGLKTVEPHWKTYRVLNENFRLLKSEASRYEPTPQDLSVVDLFKDEHVRTILRGIEKAGQFFLDESMDEGYRNVMMGYIDMLLSNGLINREFIVFCRNNNVQVSRVTDIRAIEEASSRGLKCPFCERLFSEEKINQSISLTPFGVKMTKPNLWLALFVLKLLSEAGITIEHILMKEEQETRVFDLFINLENYLVLIEIKDTPPRLDELFMFSSRIDFCKPDQSIFITTAPLATDTRMFMKKMETVTVIEKLEDLEEQFRKTFVALKGEYIRDVLSRFESLSNLNISELFTQFSIDRELAELQEALRAEEEARVEPELAVPEGVEVPTPVEVTSSQEEVEEDNYMPEEAIPGTYEPMEKPEEAEKVEELPEEVYEEAIEAKPFEEHPRETEAAVEEQAEAVKAEPETIAPEQVEVEAGVTQEASEAQATVEETAEGGDESAVAEKSREGTDDSDLFETDTTEGYLLEEQIATTYQQEIMTFEVSPMEKSMDEAREQTVRKISQEIQDNGISNNTQALTDLLRDLKTTNSYSEVLVSLEGLPIIGDPNEEFDSDRFGALTTEVYRTIQNSLRESPLPELKSVYLDHTNGIIYIYPIGDTALMLQEGVEGEQEEDFAQLPGETELRNIVMKKVLEDLGKIDGMVGTIVSSTDGLSIDFTFNDNTDIDLLSSICSQIISDNEKYLKMLGDGALRQIVLFTETALYSLIPINAEGILISVLEPHISKEIWKMKLINSSLMIASSFQ